MTGGLLDEPPFVVFRLAAGLPPGWAVNWEGRWYARAELAELPTRDRVLTIAEATAVAIPTDRREHREADGAVAQVWEIHPLHGNYANDGDPHDRSGR